MGPSATAMERRAEQVAAREGRAYEPVTAVGQHNAVVVERAGLRQYNERGTEWLRDLGPRIAGRLPDVTATLSGGVERDLLEAAEVQLDRESQHSLPADRALQKAQQPHPENGRASPKEKVEPIMQEQLLHA